MKKKIYTLCLLFFSIMLCGCNNSSTRSDTQTSVMTQGKEYEYDLDSTYDKAVSLCDSNVEICDVNDEFAQKWYDLSVYYYKCIQEAEFDEGDETKKDIVESIHSEWKEYAEFRLEAEQKRLEGIYGAGTIVPVELSQYKYELYRLHAIDMYKMCKQLFIDCVSLEF